MPSPTAFPSGAAVNIRGGVNLCHFYASLYGSAKFDIDRRSEVV
jgi:hypothetical protein